MLELAVIWVFALSYTFTSGKHDLWVENHPTQEACERSRGEYLRAELSERVTLTSASHCRPLVLLELKR